MLGCSVPAVKTAAAPNSIPVFPTAALISITAAQVPFAASIPSQQL